MSYEMKYFTVAEFTRSATAIKKGFNNTVPDIYNANFAVLAEQMDIIRQIVDAPIVITSGYRCKRLNSWVGGARNSDHLFACAADFVVLDSETGHRDLRSVFTHLRNLRAENIDLGFGKLEWRQMILEHYDPDDTSVGWIHFAVKPVAFGNVGDSVDLIYDGRKYHKADEYQWG